MGSRSPRRYTWPFSDDPARDFPEDVVREFESLRVAFEKGRTYALLVALRELLHGVPPASSHTEPIVVAPAWVLRAAYEFIEDAFTGLAATRAKRRGRHARPWTEQTDDFVDLHRAHELLCARAAGFRGDAAYAHAAAELEGTPAATTPENLRKSYKRFQRRRRKEPWRYATFELMVPEFLALGDPKKPDLGD